MARTRKKTRINPPRNSRKPTFRRRRRVLVPVEASTASPAFCDLTGRATASNATPTSVRAAVPPLGSRLSSTAVGLPSLGTMTTPAWAGFEAAPSVGWCAGPPTSLASRSSSLSLSGLEGASSGCIARQGIRRICAHPIALRLRRLFHAWPFNHAAVTGLPRRVYDVVAAGYAVHSATWLSQVATPWCGHRGDAGAGDRRSDRPAVPC